jgi:hypothetical protein
MARRGSVGRGGSVSEDEAGENETAARALRAVGLAVTPPRHAVYRVLAGRDRLVSAGDVFDLVRAGGSRLALASVYRVLHTFVAAGIVHVFAGEENRFRMCAPAPHATWCVCGAGWSSNARRRWRVVGWCPQPGVWTSSPPWNAATSTAAAGAAVVTRSSQLASMCNDGFHAAYCI